MRTPTVALVALLPLLAGCATESSEDGPGWREGFGAPRALNVTSPDFDEGGDIPPRSTCDGENARPAIRVANVTQDARSLAVIVHDPDAPGAGGFVHWAAWNFEPEEGELPGEIAATQAVEGENGAGAVGWTGPCPPSGTHRYVFRVYALNETLGLHRGATVEQLEEAMRGRVLAWGELTGRYGRGE